MRAVPESGTSRPMIMRIVVDLPDPLGPRNPVTTPGGTSKVRLSTAVDAPYRLVNECAVIITRDGKVSAAFAEYRQTVSFLSAWHHPERWG
jgi:hypothetical protein